MSRLLGADAVDPAAGAATLEAEARRFFRVDGAILVGVAELEGRLGPLARLAPSDEPAALVEGSRAARLATALGADRECRTALLLPLRERGSLRHVLVLIDAREHQLEAGHVELANAFAEAAAAALAQLRLGAEHAALARAARTLGESLDLNRVLVRICQEAASILGADYATVLLADGGEGLRIEATYGLGPEVIGTRVPAAEGLATKCAEQERLLSVSMHWDGEPRGAVEVGYLEPTLVTPGRVTLLEAFADLAAAACRNASAHAGVVVAARTDSLTGCLNRAALHDALLRELERCRRTGHSLSLTIVDLDDFKQVNETHGHLAGDEVLRRVGDALRQAVRAYDLVARYGGDEFAIVAIETGEREAAEVAGRAIAGVARAVRGVDRFGETAGATAGVAEWVAGESPTALIERADHALFHGKQQGRRGVAVRASELPPQEASSESSEERQSRSTPAS